MSSQHWDRGHLLRTTLRSRIRAGETPALPVPIDSHTIAVVASESQHMLIPIPLARTTFQPSIRSAHTQGDGSSY